MSKRTVAEWLGDIISWGERLEGHIAGMEFDEFLKDPRRKTRLPSAPNRSAWQQTS